MSDGIRAYEAKNGDEKKRMKKIEAGREFWKRKKKPAGKNETKRDRGKKNYDVYVFTFREWVFCIGEAAALCCGINYLCYRSLWAFAGAVPLGSWYVKWKKKNRIEKRRKLLAYHFQDVLHGLQTAVRAGYSMEHAVGECRRELEQIYGEKDDLVEELVYMERQMKVGIPVEQLFLDLGQRTGVEDIRNFGEIFAISRRSGGNLGEIMEKMARVMGEKMRIGREIDVSIAGKRMEQTVMSLVPGGMILYMQITSEGFLDVLYHSVVGTFVMTVCLGIYIFSFRLGRKIVRIKI